ncbi:MAG TPA: DUF1345 domain-containing protein [Streptosporangiaceae bacterium]|nr:DUF1345 domain-containing protein [Streptosporangiaceae bacterium]
MPIGRIAFLHRPPAGGQVAGCMIIGTALAVVMWQYTLPAPALLTGWDIAAATYLAMVWVAVSPMNAEVTARMAGREDPSNPVAEVVVVAASIAALVAIGFALARAGESTGSTKALLIGLGAVSVVASWLVVHTVYMLRYARSYYSEPPGGIDFNEEDRPAYLEFAYFSFTIGMTFQVSDTTITSKGIRRLTLHHALLSFLFGAVILATAINIFASLLH